MLSRRRSTQELGRRLRLLREQRNVGVRELAKMTGFSHSKVSRIENGKSAVAVQDVLRICDKLSAKPTTIRSLLQLVERLGEPDGVVKPRFAAQLSIQCNDFLELDRKYRSRVRIENTFIPYFCQTPEYILRLFGSIPGITLSKSDFLASKLKSAAEAVTGSQDRMHLIAIDVLRNPVLPPGEWSEQLRALRRSLVYVREDFGIVVTQSDGRGKTQTILENSVVLSEAWDGWSFRSASAADIANVDRLAKDAVWDDEAVSLVDEIIRELELSVDVREPNRVFDFRN